MEHPMLTELLMPIIELYNDVKRKALMRLEYEGLHTTEAITLPGSRFHNDSTGYAMDRYAYYVCYKCNKVSKYFTKLIHKFIGNKFFFCLYALRITCSLYSLLCIILGIRL